jgi:hypothetical protein
MLFHAIDRHVVECGDGGPPGRLAPVQHIAEPLAVLRKRVEAGAAELYHEMLEHRYSIAMT